MINFALACDEDEDCLSHVRDNRQKRRNGRSELHKDCAISVMIGMSLVRIVVNLVTIGASLVTIGANLVTIGASFVTIGASLVTIGVSSVNI